MSQSASVDRNSESVQLPTAATSALWLFTVHDRLMGAPERTLLGTLTAVTTRSVGGGNSITMGTALGRSLLRSLVS